MDNIDLVQLAVTLTGADVISGYISNDPIIEDRDQLIKSRLEFYTSMLNDSLQSLAEGEEDLSLVYKKFHQAVELTHADIESLYISIEPILYDRDEMISQRIVVHYNQLSSLS